MSIKKRAIITALFIWFFVIIVVNLFLVPINKKLIEDLIIDYTNAFVQKQLDGLLGLFSDRLDYIDSRADLFSHNEIVAQSNSDFEKLTYDEISKRLNIGDSVWSNDNEPLVKEVLNNQLSQTMVTDFRSGDYYKNTYGFEIFPEVFVTNKYGAAVATTNKTTDYNQSDEEWWIKTKELGIYIESLNYDESSKTYALSLGVAMKDSQGNFMGAVKAILNIEDILRDIVKTKVITDGSEFEPTDIFLFTNDFQRIYPSKVINDSTLSEFLNKFKDTFIQGKHQHGEIIRNRCFNKESKNCIFNYASLKNFHNLDLTLVLSHTEDEINETINLTRLNSITNTTLSVFLSLVLFIYILSDITKQLFDITKIINLVSEGNYSVRIPVKKRDELGIASENFNRMLDTITRTKVFEETILGNIDYAILIIDNDRKISFINNAAKRLLGYDINYNILIGQKYNQILQFYKEGDGKIEPTFIEDTFKNIQKNETSNLEITNRQDVKIPIACLASPIKDIKGNQMGTVIVIRDVTEYTRIAKAKTEFVSIASHQLRTPLASIRWYSEALLKGIGNVTKPTEDQMPYINTILDSTTRIINLVNALLNVSRLEVGTFTIEPEKVRLHEVMQESIQMVKPKMEEKKLKLETICSPQVPEVMIDKNIIGIVFQNLVANAVNYTPNEGTISIEGKIVTDPKVVGKIPFYKGDKAIQVTVKDTGLGIPAHQQKEIFTKLFRADNIKKISESGTGLGLYTCKLIMDNIGGAIWFESEENKGTTFYVLLPVEGMQERREGKKLEFK